MSYFSDLLSAYSKRIGINSPQIAGYCGLDRVTVYRFMKGKTLPKDRALSTGKRGAEGCLKKHLQLHRRDPGQVPELKQQPDQLSV